MKHKSEDYKISAVEYYLVEDKSQEEVFKIISLFFNFHWGRIALCSRSSPRN